MKRGKDTSMMPMTLLILFCISGCGFDGDDNSNPSAPPAYTGIADPAPITGNNAQTLTTGALNGAATSLAIQTSDSLHNETINQKEVPINGYLLKTVFALKSTVENYNFSKAIKAASSTIKIIKPSAVIKKSGTIPGNCGGEAAFTIQINDQTGDFTGSFDFEEYCDGGITLNGFAAVDGIFLLLTEEFEILNMQLTNLSSGNYIILTGDISINYKGFPPQILVSADFLNKKLSSGKIYWINDYTLNIIDNTTDFEVDLTGRYYDPDYGYVDVSTPNILIYDLNAEWPRSGELLCEGEKSAAKLTDISNTTYFVDADRNGDGVYELNLGPFLWSDL